jgi:uncharacterized membrane protein (DUF2068 family)
MTQDESAMKENGKPMAESKPEGRSARHHDGGLLAIGLFKLLEAVFFLLVGMGAIHYVHRDLGDAATHFAQALHFNTGERWVSLVIDKLDGLTAHRLKQIGVFTIAFSAIRVAEGIGLVFEKVWAEYLTVGVTISFLPWELYELARRPNWFRASLLVANLCVLAYLVWWLQRKKPGGVAAGA